ncbi:alpha/beta fold hydrolase [Streptomyces sp. NPDC127068]|uniref:alpha/beta fold hydrolase n=1 Tax=Streptomyces sp. NPDC127068 TaxID=3347127 RepID=UPI003668817A
MTAGPGGRTGREEQRRAARGYGIPDVGAHSPDAKAPATPTGGTAKDADAALADLFQRLCADGRVADAMNLLRTAAARRPSYDTGRAWSAGVDCVTLAEGPSAPFLFCLPSPVIAGSPSQYASLSACLAPRDVMACRLPGYRAGESLPASRDALVAVLARAVRRSAQGRPYVLLGHSGGGWLAYETARRLVASPERPTGVVLIDSGVPDQVTPQALAVLLRLAHRGAEAGSAGLSTLTAMSRHLDLFNDWSPRPLAVPTFFVAAAEPSAGVRAMWPLACDRGRTEGDHFSLMNEYAGTTAHVIDAWLVRLATPPQGDRR